MASEQTPDAIAHRLGLAGTQDLILHLPLRYLDETRLTPLAEAKLGEFVQVEGWVRHAEVQNRPRRQLIVEIGDSDDAADIAATTLFFRLLHFYPSQLAQLKPGVRVRLLGEVRPGFFGAEMVHPQLRVVRADTTLPDTLTPVYPAVAGLSQNAIRKSVAAALQATDLADSLPERLVPGLGLPGFRPALEHLHHPPPGADLARLESRDDPAWRRIKFDELLAQQLSLRLAARQRHKLAAPRLAGDGDLTERLLAALPFQLTAAQRRALEEIRRDLARPHPMNRLLQGDVGSGKTLVAVLTALPALAAGGQVAVMAPTEILAEQLFLKFHEWLQPLGLQVAWLAAAIKGKAKQQALAAIADGQARVAVGTHALFQAGVVFHNLTLAIVDEQHRFGVAQRLALREKGTPTHPSPLSPHLLMMSATPIPRSLAMSYYADLDVSVIDELPPGRTPIVTRLVSHGRRDEVVARLRDYCLGGAQAYWVCPLVEESEKLQLRAAQESHAELVQLLPELAIGLVHGRMKAEEKAAVMADFKAGKLNLLVATTVIEVGVDVPNAALMVIEHAERYGLAQLHQLRGRVGRGSRESTCLLMYGAPLSDSAKQRLRIIKENTDGFAIAREDLKLRGPGEFLGARQSGQQILRFADLETDLDLLEAARTTANDLLARDPEVVERHLDRWLPRGLDYLRA
jgi:ATP-dependent DNA helicase RecG